MTNNLTHTLRGDWRGNVWLDGKSLSPEKSQQLKNHSPDGFGWGGYGGSGPSQLALAVILELTGKSDGYHEFKWEVIAELPQGPFEIEFTIPKKWVRKDWQHVSYTFHHIGGKEKQHEKNHA